MYSNDQVYFLLIIEIDSILRGNKQFFFFPLVFFKWEYT